MVFKSCKLLFQILKWSVAIPLLKFPCIHFLSLVLMWHPSSTLTTACQHSRHFQAKFLTRHFLTQPEGSGVQNKLATISFNSNLLLTVFRFCWSKWHPKGMSENEGLYTSSCDGYPWYLSCWPGSLHCDAFHGQWQSPLISQETQTRVTSFWRWRYWSGIINKVLAVHWAGTVYMG